MIRNGLERSKRHSIVVDTPAVNFFEGALLGKRRAWSGRDDAP